MTRRRRMKEIRAEGHDVAQDKWQNFGKTRPELEASFQGVAQDCFSDDAEREEFWQGVIEFLDELSALGKI